MDKQLTKDQKNKLLNIMELYIEQLEIILNSSKADNQVFILGWLDDFSCRIERSIQSFILDLEVDEWISQI